MEIINTWMMTVRGLVVFSILQSAMGLSGRGESLFGVSRGLFCSLICEGKVYIQVFVALGSRCLGYTTMVSDLLVGWHFSRPGNRAGR